MDEATDTPKKTRGWPKGKKRGPKHAPAPLFTSAVEMPAPINVRVTLRNGAEPVEFGCARRLIENGFHVFFYPSKTDPYRETRREFAISEIVEIEITEARQVYNFAIPPQKASTNVVTYGDANMPQTTPTPGTGPKIHSARQNASTIVQALEQSSGPIKMDKMPNLSFGDSEA